MIAASLDAVLFAHMEIGNMIAALGPIEKSMIEDGTTRYEMYLHAVNYANPCHLRVVDVATGHVAVQRSYANEELTASAWKRLRAEIIKAGGEITE